jgi:hypothetical protein
MKNLIQKNVSMKEFKTFVLSQPDSRLIDLDYTSSENLGCPLVHFVRKNFKRKVFRVGFSSAYTDRHAISFNGDVSDFMLELIRFNATSYKKAKKLIEKYK